MTSFFLAYSEILVHCDFCFNQEDAQHGRGVAFPERESDNA